MFRVALAAYRRGKAGQQPWSLLLGSRLRSAGLLLLLLNVIPTEQVASDRWRIVGRDSYRGAEGWVVNRVSFFTDIACSEPFRIKTVPFRVRQKYHTGHAFSGPQRRTVSNMIDADAWEDNGVSWRTGPVSCSASDDKCFVGFNFVADMVSNQVTADGYATTGLVSYSQVEPQCVQVDQDPSKYCNTLKVQYYCDQHGRADCTQGTWITVETKTVANGGLTTIRIQILNPGLGNSWPR